MNLTTSPDLLVVSQHPWLPNFLQKYSTTQLTLGALGLFVLILTIDELFFAPEFFLDLPRYGNGRIRAWLTWSPIARMDLHNATQQGYDEVNMRQGKPFVIKMSGLDTVVLPPKYLASLKSETRSRLSLAESFNSLLNMEATVGPDAIHDQLEIEVVGKFLNPNLTQLTPFMVDQLRYALDKQVGPLPDWKTFGIHQLNNEIVNLLVNRMLVGKELSRNPDYIKVCQSYVFTFILNGFAWNFRPPRLLAPWVYWLASIPHRNDIRRTMKYLIPLVEKRAAELPSQDPKNKPMDMVQWLLEMPLSTPEEGTARKHADRVLHLTFASTAVSMALITHLLHMVLKHPEYFEPLREEIANSCQEHGEWTEKALSNMPKLDSFVRETIRLHPPGITTGHRTVLRENWQFGDDLSIPPNTRVCFPTMPIHLDPNNYELPTQFMPFRFVNAKKNADGTSEESLGASQIDSTYLSFGYGKQVCPGRFFAVRQVKLVFATLLQNYDMQWGDDTRPVYMTVEGAVFASMSTKIKLKDRARKA